MVCVIPRCGSSMHRVPSFSYGHWTHHAADCFVVERGSVNHPK